MKASGDDYVVVCIGGPRSFWEQVKQNARESTISVAAFMRIAGAEKMRAKSSVPANDHGGGGE
jgi:hypothetical protein